MISLISDTNCWINYWYQNQSHKTSELGLAQSQLHRLKPCTLSVTQSNFGKTNFKGKNLYFLDSFNQRSCTGGESVSHATKRAVINFESQLLWTESFPLESIKIKREKEAKEKAASRVLAPSFSLWIFIMLTLNWMRFYFFFFFSFLFRSNIFFYVGGLCLKSSGMDKYEITIWPHIKTRFMWEKWQNLPMEEKPSVSFLIQTMFYFDII